MKGSGRCVTVGNIPASSRVYWINPDNLGLGQRTRVLHVTKQKGQLPFYICVLYVIDVRNGSTINQVTPPPLNLCVFIPMVGQKGRIGNVWSKIRWSGSVFEIKRNERGTASQQIHFIGFVNQFEVQDEFLIYKTGTVFGACYTRAPLLLGFSLNWLKWKSYVNWHVFHFPFFLQQICTKYILPKLVVKRAVSCFACEVLSPNLAKVTCCPDLNVYSVSTIPSEEFRNNA